MTVAPASASFYVVSGTLPLNSQSYVPRQADKELLAALLAGEYCFVLNSRQMGKSSLSVRTMAKLQKAGVKTVFLDIQKFGGSNVTPEQWYIGLLSETGRALGLRKEFLTYWKENQEYSLVQRYFGALHDVALANIESRIVLFIDEIDAVKSLSFSTDEFFAAIRECYNHRAQEPQYGRLAFALVGSALPSDLIQDTRTSPFNIGKRIELKDFTQEEMLPLAAGIAHPNAQTLIQRAFYWTNGHPFLTQALCAEIAVAPKVQTVSDVDKLVAGMFFEGNARERNVNLADVSNRILNSCLDPGQKEEHRAAILDLFRQVLSGRHRVRDDETNHIVAVLKLSGITKSVQGELQVRNRIYAHAFDRAWIRTNTPGVERRRQRSAFRRGVLGTAMAMGAILFLGISGFMLTHHQRHLDRHVPLSDGTELIIDDVTYGKEAAYEPGAFRWSALLGRSPVQTSFPQPMLTLWLSQYHPNTGNTDALTNYAGIIAVDEHGHQFVPHDAGQESTGSGLPFTRQRQVTRISFANFPRRSKTIHLQLLGLPAGNGNIAVLTKEFAVPNPTTTLYPLWTPEPLPSTKMVGDLAVTLHSVKWSRPSQAIYNGVQIQGFYVINSDFECRESGRPAAWPWQTQSIEMSDATGNASEGTVGGSLCIYEPAWRLRLRLARPVEAAFTPSETWTQQGVKMPKDGTVVLLTGNGNVNGVTLKPISLAAAPSVTYTNGMLVKASGPLGKGWDERTIGLGSSIGTSSSSGRRDDVVVTGSAPQIAVRVQGLKADQKLTVWATDASGRRFNQGWGSMMVNSADHTPIYFLLLAIPQNVHQVDLHFSVQNIKTVEFMVRPPLPGMGDASQQH